MKQILITGTSSGIGHGLAQHYLEQGARVYGLSRRKPSLTGHYRHVAADFADLEAIPSALARLLDEAQELDLVALNAGLLGEIADMPDQNLDAIKHLMDVNVWANKVVLDWLFANVRTSQIVAISSGAAVNGNRGWGGYSLSKATLNMLVQLYAREQPDCHIMALAPGLVYTRMQDHLRTIHDARFPSMDRLRAAHDTPNMPPPAEFAPRLQQVIEDVLPQHESGGFVDIRQL